MQGTGRKHFIRIAVTGILFLLLLCGNASAAKDWTLTASCPSCSSEKVTVRHSNSGSVLSLPGFWDLTAVTLELKGSETFYLGTKQREITAGQPTDLTRLTGNKLAVMDGKKHTLGYVTILQGSRIPALFLKVNGNELKKVNRSKGYAITEGSAVFAEADGTVSYDGALKQLKSRGNITFSYSKKPYQIKLEKKASLGGMSKGKTWILLANYTDVSMLRNQIVLDMCREIGLRYSLESVQTDIWINGIYQGLYLLTEKIQIGKGRVEITDLEEATEEVNGSPLEPGPLEKKKKDGYKLFRSYPAVQDPEDITGGFIATIEKNFRMKKFDQPGFRTNDMLNIYIKEPTYPSKAQTEYFGKLITEMQHALLAKDGIAPETGKSYREYLDVDSFALKFLAEDWCKNYDFLGGSQFIYKDSDRIDQLIYAGPAWDYDLSFGNMSDKGHMPTETFLINFKQNNNIYWILYRHEDFRNRLSELWQSTFRPAAGILLGETAPQQDGALRSFEEYRSRIEASAAMNNRRWGVSSKASADEAGISFSNATRYLRQWIKDRTAAMDKQFGSGAGTKKK